MLKINLMLYIFILPRAKPLNAPKIPEEMSLAWMSSFQIEKESCSPWDTPVRHKCHQVSVQVLLAFVTPL